jgi:hypothetical protein
VAQVPGAAVAAAVMQPDRKGQREAEGYDGLVEVAAVHPHREEEERHASMGWAAAVVLEQHDHAVEAHTAPEVAVAPQELHLVDVPAEELDLGRLVGMAQDRGPCVGAGLRCDLAWVAEEHVLVRSRAEAAEELLLGTDCEPHTSN